LPPFSSIYPGATKVITLLNSDLSMDQLPLFVAVQYIPEIIDGFLIIVYLSYLGVDWQGLDFC